MRVGLGYDSHRFADGRRLVLGGVEIEHAQGLAGHSDADAVAHAITDAILGACGLGDIGRHFPPTDEAWRDADSIDLLRRAGLLAAEQNYQVINIDVTVVCEAPRIGPHAADMCARVAGAIGIAPAAVSVKGKTNEGMGWIGRGEGVAAMAVVLVDRLDG
ncbi:MAG TPA: 2-C-methyl-D-erythritol 2,4-cyclodiphosphate synthase [Longimicrobiales bacterium]|nr:2-C-methyl-D-erythritol 2,4-cyclodiphosphate synthase [Longimicrobiales bacterium]